jgi:hypothetical protein
LAVHGLALWKAFLVPHRKALVGHAKSEPAWVAAPQQTLALLDRWVAGEPPGDAAALTLGLQQAGEVASENVSSTEGAEAAVYAIGLLAWPLAVYLDSLGATGLDWQGSPEEDFASPLLEAMDNGDDQDRLAVAQATALAPRG